MAYDNSDSQSAEEERMSNEKALTPVDQRIVDFYGDQITAVLVETDEDELVFVPIRPICDFLGVTWSPQRRRILRDPIRGSDVRDRYGHRHRPREPAPTKQRDVMPAPGLSEWLAVRHQCRTSQPRC